MTKRQRVFHRLAVLQHGRCFLCFGPLTGGGNVDHVIPRRVVAARGRPWNRAATHEFCNHEKDDRLPTIDELARLSALHNVRLRRIVSLAYRDAAEAEIPAALAETQQRIETEHQEARP